MKQRQHGMIDLREKEMTKPEINSKFIAKAATWFIATIAGGVWISTFISGCGI